MLFPCFLRKQWPILHSYFDISDIYKRYINYLSVIIMLTFSVEKVCKLL